MTAVGHGARVQHAAIGPRTHGVVRYASTLEAHRRLDAPPTALGVHVSHSLPGEARAELSAASARPRTVATFHDLDGATDRPELRHAYDPVARTAELLVAPSDEEAELLAATWGGGRAAVVPHHVDRRTVLAQEHARRRLVLDDRPRVGLLGHQYPGKGSEDVVRAAAALGGGVELVLVGGAAAEHAAQVTALRALARAAGVPLRRTGWLDDGELDAWLAVVDVAVVPSGRAAASGSLATWVGAGRAPLVRRGRPADRHAASHWGVVLPRFDPPELREALADALDAPTTTRLPRGTAAPGPATTAARYDALVGDASNA